MKKILLSMMLGVFSITGSAQGNLQFTINRSSQKDISETVVNALDLKLKQVMNRNSAAAADAYNVFAIDPSIELTDIVSTQHHALGAIKVKPMLKQLRALCCHTAHYRITGTCSKHSIEGLLALDATSPFNFGSINGG